MYPVKSLLEDCPIGHSDFQCDNFITKKSGGPTIWGQYKQALREFSVRYDSFVAFAFDFKKRMHKINIAERELVKAQTRKLDEDVLELYKLKLDKKKYYFERAKEDFAKAQKEMLRFYAQSCVLKSKIEKEFGPITEDLKKRFEEEYWLVAAFDIAAITWQTSDNLDEVIKAVMTKVPNFSSFPSTLQESILTQVKNKNNTVASWKNRQREFLTENEINEIQTNISEKQMLEDILGNTKLLE